ncbi:hypothetical protein F5972_08295 [Microbispora cellulosiformans]|uniref:Uncharacterized protein n=1 Tax=Microbispora cellulosiformans TaxID=2614688 RepID=A0A5J5K855_9ACTN|nr:hypothetical protein [Microbispora cellulosiformans]KAA9379643.1 hypothetical protein F5972_08295 [Microbispora cellulosiformans]
MGGFTGVWTLVGACIGAVTTLLAVWLKHKFERQRFKLFWRVMEVVPIVTDETRDHLTLFHNSVPVKDPHTVKFRLDAEGPNDLDADAFKQPIKAEIGAKILDVVKEEAIPSSPPALPRHWNGNTLLIDPGHIGRQQQVTYTLLVEQKPPRPTKDKVTGSLVNVDLLPYPTGPSRKRTLFQSVCVLVGVALSVGASFSEFFTGANSITVGVTIIGFVLFILAFPWRIVKG